MDNRVWDPEARVPKRSRATFEADLKKQQSPYVFFGTPLPPIDSHVRDDGSYVPVWKQEVVDERGRKRLHGAFTGGFSAGYFNSVGSKEGWTPQTFVSSRLNRAQNAQKVEDFMDEEDLADAEEAKQLETKGGYAGFGLTEEEVGKHADFMDLFRPDRGETMGVKLLRRMGWRDGDGIGPKARTKSKLHEPDDPGGGGQETEPVAPENTKLISFVGKTNTKGLGFESEQGRATVSRPSVQMPNAAMREVAGKNKKIQSAARRGGIGIGVLNDTGSDEEDPYDMGPKLSSGRSTIQKKKKKQEAKKGAIGSPNPLLKERPIFVSKKLTGLSGFRCCHDGRLPLDGFVLSKKGPFQQETRYPPPKVPEGWTSSKKSSATLEPSGDQPSANDIKSSSLDPSSRAALLGEQTLPGKSIFDFLTPAARDKLVAVSNNPNLPAAGSEAPTITPSLPSSQDIIPPLEPRVAATALGRGTGGFVPYADNPAKLGRYRAFLTYRAGLDSSLAPPTCPPGMRQQDFLSELHEFAHAATIFKPMTGAMASRFTTSSTTPQASVSKDEDGNDKPLLSQHRSKPLAPEEEAARLGMFGPLTRITAPFHPTRLLCKRFGVRPPAHVMPEPADESVPTSSGGHAKKGNGTADVLAGFGDRFTSGGMQHSENDEVRRRRDKLEILGKRDMENLRRASGLPALGEVVRRKEREIAVDPSRNEALEAERPSDATFKEIFGDDL